MRKKSQESTRIETKEESDNESDKVDVGLFTAEPL